MLEISHITTGYGRNQIVHDVSAHVQRGRVTGLIGANGSGKSTLVKAVAGRLPHSGEVKISGTLGYMPQQADIDWDFPATLADAALFGRIPSLKWWQWPGRADKKAALEALDRVGLKDKANDPISALSGGQRQRTMLARTLAADPDLLILDEPFAGVDANSQATIVNVLRELNADGATIILVHHDLAEVADYCDDVILLNQGRIIDSGSTEKTLTEDNIARMFSPPGTRDSGAAA